MPQDDLDVALFDWRNVKLTFRLPTLEQDTNGEIIEDLRFAEDGSLASNRLDRLITYADIIADRLDAERAKGGLLQAAQQASISGGFTSPVPPPPAAPPMGATGYAPPTPPVETCPQCGFPGVVKTTSRGRVLECSNVNHKNDKGYPATIRWIDQQRGR